LESKDVAKIENLSRNITEIINLGIVFTSSKPNYFYTKLAEVKQEMIANATKDAKERAEKIAENAGSSLGNLKKLQWALFKLLHQTQMKIFLTEELTIQNPKKKKQA
jgi:hypothetical protein